MATQRGPRPLGHRDAHHPDHPRKHAQRHVDRQVHTPVVVNPRPLGKATGFSWGEAFTVAEWALMPAPMAAAYGLSKLMDGHNHASSRPSHVAASSGTHGKKFTQDPNEVVTRRTVLIARAVLALARKAWPGLTENGVRTLTAQSMHETEGGTHCYNWNLGNRKHEPGKPFMYLYGVWELDTPDGAQFDVASGAGLAHIATAEEIKQHGWSHPAGKTVVVYEPPHKQARFRAYASLQDGVEHWVALLNQRTESKHVEFVTALNSGNCPAVAKILKQAHYYSDTEAVYAKGMTTHKLKIDKDLGPAT